jgi:transposase-like protein
VHPIRNSLDYAGRQERKALVSAWKPICAAPTAEAARAEPDRLEAGSRGRKFPTVGAT